MQNHKDKYLNQSISTFISPILVNRHHVVELAVHDPIIVQEQPFTLIISSCQEPRWSFLPGQVKDMLFLLRGKGTHLFLILVNFGQHLIHIVNKLESIHDIVFNFEMNPQPPHRPLLDSELVCVLG